MECVIFGVDNSFFELADNRRKDILVFGEGQADRLDGTTITAKLKHSINITKSWKEICLSLRYNRNSSF